MPGRRSVAGRVAQARGATGAARPSLVRTGGGWLTSLVGGALPTPQQLAGASASDLEAILSSPLGMASLAADDEAWAALIASTAMTPWVNPQMAANSSGGYTASASSEYSSGQAAWKAFDKSFDQTAAGWQTTGSTTPAWIMLEFPAARHVHTVAYYPRTNQTYHPRATLLEGRVGGVWHQMWSGEIANNGTVKDLRCTAGVGRVDAVRLTATTLWGSFLDAPEILVEGWE